MKKIFEKIIIALTILVFFACTNTIDSEKTDSDFATVYFSLSQSRAINSIPEPQSYTYTLTGKVDGKPRTICTDLSYTDFTSTAFELEFGDWDFYLEAKLLDKSIYTALKKGIILSYGITLNFTLIPVTEGSASVSVKLNYPQNKGVAKITAGLYDNVFAEDSGTELTLGSFVTFSCDTVPPDTTKFVKFFLYDSQNVQVAGFTESVCLLNGDNVEVERTLENVNLFTGTVFVINNDEPWIDSGLEIKAVKDSKQYTLTTSTGTNVYTASLPQGTYDVYVSGADSGVDLTVVFAGTGSASLSYELQFASKENFASVVENLTEASTIVVTGEITSTDLSTLRTAIQNSSYNITLDLSRVTGLTELSYQAFYQCSKLAGITIGDSVTSIGGEAFRNCSSLESITIPDSVTSIGQWTFDGCSSLESVTIPDSVTSIGSYAFLGCRSLESVTIPDSVTSIGVSAFSGCRSLESVTIPDSVTSIGSYAFRYCNSLLEIIVDENNTSYSSVDGILFNKKQSVLIQYPRGKTLSTYTIPDSVTSIGECAFEYCTSLESIKIPDSVTSIGDEAFEYCTSLTSITIPDSVTSIGEYAFAHCTSLTSITIPDSVTSIGIYAFEYCTSLTSIKISDSVTSIGHQTFRGCSSLESVTIPDLVTWIGIYAFKDCTSLTSVTIGDSVTSIGREAFYNCSSLESVTILDSVTSIGSYAFYGCTSLTGITFNNTENWYRVLNSSDWNNKTGGTLTDLSNPATNATYFKSTYYFYYWYHLDE